jgi:ferredoxin-NADP reductase
MPVLAQNGLPARTRVCGPTAFVETIARELINLNHDPRRVKTERFGATGGPS